MGLNALMENNEMAYNVQQEQTTIEYREVTSDNAIENTTNKLLSTLAKKLGIPDGRRSVSLKTGRNLAWCIKASGRWIRDFPNDQDVCDLVDNLHVMARQCK